MEGRWSVRKSHSNGSQHGLAAVAAAHGVAPPVTKARQMHGTMHAPIHRLCRWTRRPWRTFLRAACLWCPRLRFTVAWRVREAPAGGGDALAWFWRRYGMMTRREDGALWCIVLDEGEFACWPIDGAT